MKILLILGICTILVSCGHAYKARILEDNTSVVVNTKWSYDVGDTIWISPYEREDWHIDTISTARKAVIVPIQ